MERSSPMEACPKDKVHDVAKKILGTGSESDQDVYVTIGGRVLKGSEELGSCGVRDGSTVQVVREAARWRKTQGQEIQTEKPEQKCAGEAKSNKGPAIRECDKDAVIQMMRG